MNFNTYKFFRRCFNIPRKQKVQWCLIEERVSGQTEIRLGLWLVDTSYYVDVASRRFFTECQIPAITRVIHPAYRMLSGTDFNYVAGSDMSLLLPKSYIEDIYQTTLYDCLPESIL